MTVKELKGYLSHLKDCDDDLEVRIPINDGPTLGPIASMDIRTVCRGVDWDRQSLFFYPKKELCKKGIKK